MKKTVYNENSTGHITGKYPLLFGEPMGPYDTMNRNYPKIFELYDKQMGRIWYSTEVSVAQDRIDAKTCDKNVLAFMTDNIMWQTAQDTIAAKSISELFEKHITNPEFKSLIKAWSLFEDIHEQSYSDIVQNVFDKPNEIIDGILNNPDIVSRSRKFIDVFNDFYNLPMDAPITDLRKGAIKSFAAVYAMESISFMASFAITFTIASMGIFAGVGSRVRQIARDEQLHQHMAWEVLRIMRDVEKYPEWNEAIPEIKEILDAIVEQEKQWISYLFKDTESVGLTKEFMFTVVEFFATPVYMKLKIQAPFELVTENPVAHLSDYFDTSLIQTASQEIEQTSYVSGSLEDDIGKDTDFDFDMEDF